MSYPKFTLDQLQEQFQISIVSAPGLFSAIGERNLSNFFTQLLQINLPLAFELTTEKARSELIVLPALVELKQQLGKRISIFSGLKFDVEPKRGLKGECDFLVSQSDKQLVLEAPVIVLVEAKKADFSLGLPQCLAEMIAARIFNERKKRPLKTIYGCVTTGLHWHFMRLTGSLAEVDSRSYDIEHPQQILGILAELVERSEKEL